VIIPTAVLLLAMQASAPTCRTADPRVERLIEAKAQELQGAEYCQFRLYHTLDDIDGDQKDDFLVVFSIEGISGSSNGTEQFLAAFTSRTEWRPVVVKVGARGVRFVDSIDVRDHTIVLKTLEYKSGDANCCPSGHGKLAFRFKSGALAPTAVPKDE